MAMKLTLSRIALAPIFLVVALIFTEGNPNIMFAIGVSLVCIAILVELTDVADGWIARRTRCVSIAGAVVDPMADSMARLTIFFVLASEGIIPVWPVIVCLWRDIEVATLRQLCYGLYGQRLPTLSTGKWKAIAQGIASVTLVVLGKFGGSISSVRPLSLGIILVATLVTVLSGLHYMHSWRPTQVSMENQEGRTT